MAGGVWVRKMESEKWDTGGDHVKRGKHSQGDGPCQNRTLSGFCPAWHPGDLEVEIAIPHATTHVIDRRTELGNKLAKPPQFMRHTKIIATLGPATESPEMLGRMIDGGLNICRLNMSHSTHEWVRRVVTDIRAVATERGVCIGILMDTQGPSIRTGDLPAKIRLHPGAKFTFTVNGAKIGEGNSASVNYPGFVEDVHVGNIVLVDNGVIQMRVVAKGDDRVECDVLTEGELGSRRHINLPGVKVNLPPLTEKDIADVKLGVELALDFIALSFVRSATDIQVLRQLIAECGAHHPRIVAKIEDQQAVKHFEAILLQSDAVMVARGDLGIEVSYEELPIIQRRIVKSCLRIGRPVIVATHMLESMIQSPMPTRAEVTDVANAVFEQADAIMLSGETTVGMYPLKCVEVFDRVAARIERSGGANFAERAELDDPRKKIARSAVVMADELRARAIVTLVRSGTMTRYISWLRPRYSTIYAVCRGGGTAGSLTLYRGVVPVVTEFDPETLERNIGLALDSLAKKHLLRKGDVVVTVTSVPAGDQTINTVQMRTV